MSRSSLHICLFADERSIHTRRWVTGLRQLGHRVDLITLIKDQNYDVGGISLGAVSKLSYLTKIARLRKVVGEMKPEILHAHYASSYGFLASFVNHPRKVLSVWGDDVIVFPYRNPVFKTMVRRAIRSARYITATSLCLEKAVKALAPETTGITVIAFGIDMDRFAFSVRPSGEIVRIGIAKSLRPKYGIDILLKAFQELSAGNGNVFLSIAGKGEYEGRYKAMVENLGLSDMVEFTGFVDYSLLPKFLAQIDIFVMPSVSDGESFGVAAVEASATGLPVVASRVGGIPEVVQDNATGFLVERRNVHELAAALEKLVVDVDLRRSMGKAGREFVEKKYRWEHCLESMEKLYRDIIK